MKDLLVNIFYGIASLLIISIFLIGVGVMVDYFKYWFPPLLVLMLVAGVGKTVREMM